ncbi:uncharacterized protein PAC_06980 [Phialocephala subalpina]|uniref:Uncharacterized protein n=1 Tax=Phialocephala subalpina TaxID=576137 RepID=A0A1L7WWE4_9HELO|nr:uncharacterized protein PAC_06980 [Phialocephala subalpina]
MPPKASKNPPPDDESRKEIDDVLTDYKKSMKEAIEQKQEDQAKRFQAILDKWQKETLTEIDRIFTGVRDRMLAALDLEEEGEEAGPLSGQGKAKATKGKGAGKKVQPEKGKAPANSREENSESPRMRAAEEEDNDEEEGVPSEPPAKSLRQQR